MYGSPWMAGWGRKVAAPWALICAILALPVTASAGTPPIVTAQNTMITEADTNSAVATFDVTLSKKFKKKVTVSYETHDGTADAGSDYIPTDGVLHFKPGQKTKHVEVTIVGDVLTESAENFTLRLTSPKNAVLGDDGTATILDNDTDPTPSSVVVTPVTPTKRQDDTQQFTATANFAGGGIADVTSLATWSSATPSVATITSSGLATPIDQGTSAIHAVFRGVDGSTTMTVQCRLHSNGQGQTYENCSPLGTHNVTTATQAAEAWLATQGGGSTGVSSFACEDAAVIIAPNSAHTFVGVWEYQAGTGLTGEGHTTVVSGTLARCPAVSDPAWN